MVTIARRPRKRLHYDITRNFHGGNPQSEAANESMVPFKDPLLDIVVEYVRQQKWSGSICDEVEAALGMTHQTASPRFTEAKQQKRLVPNGEKRQTRQERWAAVLVAPEYLDEEED